MSVTHHTSEPVTTPSLSSPCCLSVHITLLLLQQTQGSVHKATPVSVLSGCKIHCAEICSCHSSGVSLVLEQEEACSSWPLQVPSGHAIDTLVLL